MTELIAALICEKDSFAEGIRYVQDLVDGSLSMLLMTKDGIYAARDKMGRTPIVVGHKEGAYCLSFESHAYINLGFQDYKELGPGEIVYVTPESVETLVEPGKEMKICSFLWVYYGYPTSAYEGVNVEEMRYRCGSMLAKRDGDSVHPDIFDHLLIFTGAWICIFIQYFLWAVISFSLLDHLTCDQLHL